MISDEYMLKAAHRMESAAQDAARAADRMEESVRQMQILFADGYGGNGAVLVELLRNQASAQKVYADGQLPQGVKRNLDVCIWMQDSDGPWNTSCGVTFEFNDGTPAENHAHFCHNCGGVLLADPFVPDAAGEES